MHPVTVPHRVPRVIVQSTKAKVISNIFQCEDGGTEIGTHKSLDQFRGRYQKSAVFFSSVKIFFGFKGIDQ